MSALRHTSTVLVLLLSWVALSFCQSADDRQASFASHIQKAQQYLDQKRPDLAIPELQAAADINPDSVETQGNLGVLLYFQGKIADAIPHLRAAVERKPGMSKIQGLLGLAELHTNDSAQGCKDLADVFPSITDPKFKIEVGLELVGAYTQTGDLDEASSIVSQLRKVAPDNPEVLYAAYRTYADLSGESMLALSLTAPDSAQMHQLLAHEESRQGNNDAAVAQYHKAIALDPHLPGIHFELAELLRTSQNTTFKKTAEQEYRLALADNPQDEKAICRLAEIDAQRGDLQQAYENYSKAATLQPGDADAALGLAKTLTDMNQSGKALPILERTVQLEPANATAHYRLGTLYRKMGRSDDARRELDLYKKYKDMKEKLRTVYKDLQTQPKEITTDEPDQK